jgi:hypothetical protein
MDLNPYAPPLVEHTQNTSPAAPVTMWGGRFVMAGFCGLVAFLSAIALLTWAMRGAAGMAAENGPFEAILHAGLVPLSLYALPTFGTLTYAFLNQQVRLGNVALGIFVLGFILQVVASILLLLP